MKILMVCLGNICRSPLAEGILKSKLPGAFIVESAGTIGNHAGEAPDPRSIKAAADHHIDISKQKSRKFIYEDFEKFDHIYCMDRQNLADVLALAKDEDSRAKVSLILPNGAEVPDPYYGNADDFEKVYQMLDAACDRIAGRLLAKK